jgi:DNA-binding HxlR family transcriptional regulator
MMRWTELTDSRCSIARSLSVVGDRWTLLILREAFLGTTRFESFFENIGAARHLVADRLKVLTANDIVRRVQYSTRPARYEYQLTDKGIELYPVIVSLLAWGDRWMPDELGPSLLLTHDHCGTSVITELRCPVCEQRVGHDDVVHTFPTTEPPDPGPDQRR